MPIITAIEPQKRRQARYNIYLDGEFAFGLDAALAWEAGLAVGQELSSEAVAELRQADAMARARDMALRFLAQRPRSETEVERRLRKAGLADDVIAATLEHLREQGLVDDDAFARYWRENREAFRPRSGRLMAQELRGKGVAAETVAAALSDLDEEESAYRAAQARAHRLTGLEYDEFRQRLADHLRRRGFNWEVIRPTVARLWQEGEGGGG